MIFLLIMVYHFISWGLIGIKKQICPRIQNIYSKIIIPAILKYENGFSLKNIVSILFADSDIII